ncbi:hypothetical protein CYY_009031 [Polysphondylium violaceum]|uniref:Attractin/MKLN-like beta-propeller domain-containing protein n=1 Tax=Polysphondylium violaceum TaxID=133409 RepID=A0A8J4PKP8_9MYCE|nr:hypothetical protein CYY_009031 [Polysphondylium violaceum]
MIMNDVSTTPKVSITDTSSPSKDSHPNNQSNSNININNNSKSIIDTWGKTVNQLECYKELSEQTLEQCDESFIQCKKKIIQDFDTLINYLNDRKVEILTQLAIELESHKQELETNRDRATILVDQLNRKINGLDNKSDHPHPLTHSNSMSNLSGVLSPLKKSTSFQTDHLQVLKESISVIEWDWCGEFQSQTTTTKIIKSPKPVSTFVCNLLNIHEEEGNGNGGSVYNDDLESKTSISIEDSNGGGGGGSSITTSSSSLLSYLSKQNNGGVGNEKEVNVFGKLEFKVVENPEYKKLNSELPEKKFIFSIGGKLNGFDQYAMEKYDFKENIWRSLEPIASMDNDFTCNYDGKNHIYLFGGSLSPTRAIKYNILENQWEKLFSTCDNEIPEGGRFLHSSVFDQKQFIYLIGGFPRSTCILKFNLFTEQFSRQSSQTKSLWNISTIYESKSNSIYLVGGCNISRQSVNNFERYDVEQDKFYALEPLPMALYSTGSVLDEKNGHIYVFGGFNSQSNQCVSHVYRYDIKHNQWQKLDAEIPKQITISNSCLYDNDQFIYIVGGYHCVTKEFTENVYRFNIKSLEFDTTIPPYLHSKLKGGCSLFISK